MKRRSQSPWLPERFGLIACGALVVIGVLLLSVRIEFASAQDAPPSAPQGEPPLDPAAWGTDHTEDYLPEFVTGDECLFCHRNDIGPTLPEDRHAQTIRAIDATHPVPEELQRVPALESVVAEIGYLVGRNDHVRYLKDGEGYNTLDMLNVHAGTDGELMHAESPEWVGGKFATDCVGCHATAVDSEFNAFLALGIDCYSCHGVVSLQHTSDTKLILLSKKREDPPHHVASICGSCHLRGGKSESTGLPYPNQFVPEDNLFRDFKVDFSDEYISKLAPDDRHIYENIRDIVIRGETATTCLTCHDVHSASSEKHEKLRPSDSCVVCHPRENLKSEWLKYEKHSETCEY